MLPSIDTLACRFLRLVLRQCIFLPRKANSQSLSVILISGFNAVSPSHPLIDLYEPLEQQQRRPHTGNKSRKQTPREKALQQQCQKLGLQGGAASVPPEQLLSVPKHKPSHPQQPVPPPHPPSAGDQRQSDDRDQQKEVTPVDPCNGSDNAQTRPAMPNSKVEKKKVELLVSR